VNEKHGGIMKYKCGLCGICLFDSKEDKKKHRLVCKLLKATSPCKVFENGDLQCTACGDAVDPRARQVKSHMNQFHPHLLFSCNMCSERCMDEWGLKLHIRKHHMGGKKFACDQCDKVYSDIKTLHKHKQFYGCGGSQAKVKCEICGQELLKVSLQGHMKRRHAAKPLPIKLKMCELCGKEVHEGDRYRYHMQVYHSTKSFQCDQCDRVFVQEGFLKKTQEKLPRDGNMRTLWKDHEKIELQEACDYKSHGGNFKAFLLYSVQKRFYQPKELQRPHEHTHWRNPPPMSLL